MLVGLCNSYGKALERKGFSSFFFVCFYWIFPNSLTRDRQTDRQTERERMTMKVEDSEDQNYRHVSSLKGDRDGTLVKVLCYKSDGRWFDSRLYHWNFSLTRSLRSHYGPAVDSVPGSFPGDKGGRCVRLTILPPSRVFVT